MVCMWRLTGCTGEYSARQNQARVHHVCRRTAFYSSALLRCIEDLACQGVAGISAHPAMPRHAPGTTATSHRMQVLLCSCNSVHIKSTASGTPLHSASIVLPAWHRMGEQLRAGDSTESSPSSPGTPIQTPFHGPLTSAADHEVATAFTSRRMRNVGYPEVSEVCACSLLASPASAAAASLVASRCCASACTPSPARGRCFAEYEFCKLCCRLPQDGQQYH